jgi:nucleoside-diphosphate-sugar epimerase
MGSPTVARLVAAGHEVGVLGRSDAKRASITQVGARGGLLAGAVDLAASRVLDIVARRGSVSSFIDTAGEFVAKDIAVVRGIAAELGGDLGVLDGVIDAGVSSAK